MSNLVVNSEVDDEFFQVYSWYAQRNLGAAQKFRAHVWQVFERVVADPLGGTVYDAGHRFYRVKKYPHLVIYRYSADDDTATIGAVSHPSQDQSYWQDR